jgi:predicted DsbA family dithiol-disulfide isomerase
MATSIRIDFVSDVSCPWCVIGLRALTDAIARVGDEAEVDIHFQPFELNPQMPPGGQNLTEHVAEKYGATREQSAATREHIRQAGASLGFTFSFGPDSRIYNTFDAHRLLHWAGLEGRQRELKEELFSAYFTRGENPSDHDVLVRIAEKAGLDRTRASEILASESYTAEVRAEEQAWLTQGIHAVPSVVLNRRHLIQGGQPPEAFERALRHVIGQGAPVAT